MITSLGVYPGDSCRDPQHPWWIPDAMHTAYECACMASQNRDTEDLCVFAMPGGTPATYTRPSNVPSIPQIILETPGWLASGAVEGAGMTVSYAAKETVKAMTPSSIVWVGVGVAALLLLKGR